MAIWTSISEAIRPARAGLVRSTTATVLGCGVVGVFVGLAPDVSARAGDDAGTRLVAVCAACHRLDGRHQGIPAIVGWPTNDLVSAMWVFRSDERSNPVMHAVSLSFSEDEIAVIARRLATMRPKAAP